MASSPSTYTPQLTQYGTSAASSKPVTMSEPSSSTTPNDEGGRATAMAAAAPASAGLGGGARAPREARSQVKREQLVAVQCVAIAPLTAGDGGKTQAAPAPERL